MFLLLLGAVAFLLGAFAAIRPRTAYRAYRNLSLRWIGFGRFYSGYIEKLEFELNEAERTGFGPVLVFGLGIGFVLVGALLIFAVVTTQF